MRLEGLKGCNVLLSAGRCVIVAFFFLLQVTPSVAQVYPVQATLQLTPPYSLYLNDYVASGTERLALNVFLADVARPELSVRFRLKIIGQGITIETKAGYIPPPVSIQGGVPLRLISTDLADYFNANNLEFQGISKREYERKGQLPEGVYQFCFEVLEYNRGVKISNTACATAWMILNDPPMINLPRQNEKLKAQSPQNVLLQWTPRHTGSPNSAFATEYDVAIVEVWPSTRNPNDAILTSPLIFETTTTSTTVVYGPAETPLEPGRRYAFRVRARSIAGVDQLDLFKNNGYSEVFTFVYGDACDLPTGISTSAISSTRFSLGWEGLFNHTAFRVRYREAGTQNWYENNTAINSVEITSLKPNTTYEYQVAATCGFYDGQYSTITKVKTNPAPETEYSCGVPVDALTLDPALYTGSLKAGDIILAGDFDVKLVKVSGGNGVFSGEGVIEVPYFNKAKVKTEFSGITVNKDLRMVNGYMNVTGAGVDIIPEGLRDVMDKLDEALDVVDSALTTIEENLPESFDPNSAVADTLINVKDGIDNVYKDDNGNVVIVDNKGNEQQVPAGTSAAIVDDAGNGYIVDKKGNIHKTTAEIATKAANRKYNLLLQFVNNNDKAHYGFDVKKNESLTGYETLENGYKVHWKSVASNAPEVVTAKFTGTTDLDPRKIHFEMGGITLPASPTIGNNQPTTVTLTGKTDGTEEGLIAVYAASDTGKVQVLGKLNVATYDEIPKTVVIVPVNDTKYPYNISILRDSLNRIYGQAVVKWTVEPAEEGIKGVSIGSPFDDGETGLLSNYTSDMKKVINAYKNEMDDDKFYLFLIGGSTKNDKSLAGYMPRSKQAGFIFIDQAGNEKQLIHTVAHELGHGAFNLNHTFNEQNITLAKGVTDNLMDYPAGGKLYKFQWDKMRHQDIVVGLFEEDEQGKNYIVSVDKKFVNPDNKSISFLTPTGGIVSIPSEFIQKVEFTYGVLSAVNQDPTNGVNYHFDLFSGYLYKFGMKEGNEYPVYVFDAASKTYKAEGTGKIYTDTIDFQSVNGFVFPIGCGKDYNLYKFEKGELPKFVNSQGEQRDFADMAALFQPFNQQVPLRSSTGEILKQNIEGLVNNSCTWCMQDATAEMTGAHCEKPELLYVDKLAQLRAVFPEYFAAFTQPENWEMPIDKSYGTEVGYVSRPPEQWAWGQYLKDHPDVKSLYNQKTDLRSYFITFCYQFRDYILTGMDGSSLFWENLNENTTPSEIVSHLRTEPGYVTQQVAFAKRKLAIKILAQNSLPEQKENGIVKLLSSIKPFEAPGILDFVATDVGFQQVFDKFDDFGGEDNFTRVVTLLSSYIENPEKNVEAYEKSLLPNPEIVSIDLDLINNKQTDGFYIDESNNVHFYNEVRKRKDPLDDPRIPAGIEKKDFLVVAYNETMPVQFYTEFEIAGTVYVRKQVADLPAIHVALLLSKGSSELFEKKVWLVADGVMLIVGVGEVKVLFTTASWMRKLAIAGELLGGVNGLVTEAMPESVLSANMKRRLRIVNLALGAPQLLRTLRNGVKSVVADLKTARNSGDATVEMRQEIDAIINRVERELGEAAFDASGSSLIRYEGGKIFHNANEIGSVDNGVLTFKEGISSAQAGAEEVLELNTVNRIVEDGIEYEAKNIKIISRNSVWVCEAEGSYCFVAGTLVQNGKQAVPIETVKINTDILTYDHTTGRNIISHVVKTFTRTVKKLAKVVIGGAVILATAEHPFYANGQYIPAQELQTGDSVLTQSGRKLAVSYVHLIDTTATVYNLEVEKQHNYYVGAEGLLVHNSCALKTIYSLLPGKEERDAFKAALRRLPTALDRADVITEITKGGDLQKIQALAKCLSKEDNMGAWQSLKRNGRTGLPHDPDPYKALIRNTQAIEALAKARQNPKLMEVLGQLNLGNADDILAKIKGHVNASYEDLMNDFNSLGTFMNTNGNTRLVQFDRLVKTLMSNSSNSSQGVHGVIKEILESPDLFKNRTLTFEYGVVHSRPNAELARIDVYTNDVPPAMIEIKWLASGNGVDKSLFVKEFIERDLFHATSLGQIVWKIRGTKLTADNVKDYLKVGRESINEMANRASDPALMSKIRHWFEMVDDAVTDAQIDAFVNTHYSSIFP